MTSGTSPALANSLAQATALSAVSPVVHTSNSTGWPSMPPRSVLRYSTAARAAFDPSGKATVSFSWLISPIFNGDPVGAGAVEAFADGVDCAFASGSSTSAAHAATVRGNATPAASAAHRRP